MFQGTVLREENVDLSENTFLELSDWLRSICHLLRDISAPWNVEQAGGRQMHLKDKDVCCYCRYNKMALNGSKEKGRATERMGG
jgi:hypothetical protein